MMEIENLEIHIAHGCNLTCESCSHYSNHGHKGLVSLDEADRWMNSWHKRVQPRVFSLLGGEPAINPHLVDYVPLVTTYWPHALLRLVTNGFLLHRHPQLPLALKKYPKSCLYLSIHHDSPEYQQQLQPVKTLLDGWVKEYGIQVEIYESFKKWTRRYKGFGAEMEPFEDMDPRRSWENCPARIYPQLYRGKIWKCPSLAYLPLQNATYRLSDKWQPYLQYKPLDPECSDEELKHFFGREEEPCCRMCSANPEHFEIPIPFSRRSSNLSG